MENDLMTKLLIVENDQSFVNKLMEPYDQSNEDQLFPSTQSYDLPHSTRQPIELQRPTFDSNSQEDSYPLFVGRLVPEYENFPLPDDSRKEGSTQGLLYLSQQSQSIFEMEKEYVITVSERAPSEDSRIAIPLLQNSKNIKRKNKQPAQATETKNFLTGIKNLLKKRGKLNGWNFKTMSLKVQELMLSKPSLSIDGFRTLLKDPDIGSHIRSYLRSNQFVMDVMTSNLEKKEVYFTYFSKLCSKMERPDTIFKIK